MASIEFRHLRVLVVDRNDYMRKIARLLLLGLGIRDVVEASEAEDWFATFARTSPDIVFVDLDAPDLCGLTAIRRLRDTNESSNAYVPIVAMSAHAVRERVAAARDAGATEFVCKPYSGKMIEERIINIVLNPRPFVRTKSFFGPDRRRFVHPNYAATERRQDIPTLEAPGGVEEPKRRRVR